MAYKTVAKNVEEQLKADEVIDFKPSDKEKAIVAKVFSLFSQAKEERDRAYSYFDGRTLVEYIEDNVSRYSSNYSNREDMEDWQSNMNQPFTRNKITAVLSRVVDSMPRIEFMPRGTEDGRKTSILNSLYRYFEDVSDNEKLLVYAVIEALVKGTAIIYEGYEEREKSIRDVVSYNGGDKIEIKERNETKRRIYASLVPIEYFYPSSMSINDIKDMPYCFIGKERTYSEFAFKNCSYSKAKYVQPNVQFNGNLADKPYYLDFISEDIGIGNVQEIEYYNQDTDEYIKIANGVWLNPIMIDGEEHVSPIPFSHKKLPFWSFVYDVFGPDMFFGKSMADKMSVLQDTMNVLNNMMIDQSLLSLLAPILSAGLDPIQDDVLRPGRRIAVDTGGLPLNQAFMKLDVGTPSGWHQFILEYTKRVMEESSVDAVSQGQAGGGDRTTATEIRSAAAGVASLLGLFSKFIKFGLVDQARLKASNILQFATQPNAPIIEQVMGIGGSKIFNKAFQTIVVDNQVLPSGKRGTTMVAMYANKKDMPTGVDIKAFQTVAEATSNKNISITAILPEYLRNIEWDVKFVPNPRSESSMEMEKALTISKIQIYTTLFPDLVNREELAIDLAEKFGDDPTKVLKPATFQTEPIVPPTPEGGGEAAMNQATNMNTGGPMAAAANMTNSLNQ